MRTTLKTGERISSIRKDRVAQKQTDRRAVNCNLVAKWIGEEEKIIIMAMLRPTLNYLCYFVTKLYTASVAFVLSTCVWNEEGKFERTGSSTG